MADSNFNIWNNFQNGSKEAFNTIYSQYVEILFDYGSRFTDHHPLVEDAIQELFIDLWIKRSQLGDVRNIRAYLFKSLKRRILRKLGSQKKLTEIDQLPEFPLIFSYEDQLIKETSDRELIKKLNHSLTKLTATQREAIFQKYYQRLSYQEVASIREVNVKAIYKLLARALNQLRSSFNIFFTILVYIKSLF